MKGKLGQRKSWILPASISKQKRNLPSASNQLSPYGSHSSQAIGSAFKSSENIILLRRWLRKYRRSLSWLLALLLITISLKTVVPLLAPHSVALVAKDSITAGTQVHIADFELISYPDHLLPANSLKSLPANGALELSKPITAGNVLTEENFSAAPSELAAEFALTSLEISDPSLFQALKVGNVLQITCINEFEKSSHKVEAKVHGIDDFPVNSGLNSAFQNQTGASVLVAVKKNELENMAYCTSGSSQFLAIIG